MQKTYAFLLILLLLACNDNHLDFDTTYSIKFDSILYSHAMEGVIVIFDPQTKTYHSNDFMQAEEGFIPASTFKIPNAIIAMETNVITDSETLLHWDGKDRDMKIWERDMTLREAFRTSCVPCFQAIAGKIGEERMKAFLNKLQYGNMYINQDIDQFWLHGNSRISPMEQIDFLHRLYSKKLPILNSTRENILSIMEIDRHTNYHLGGKTGLSNENNVVNGWFVGYLEVDQTIYYFALQASPLDPADIDTFIPNRERVVRAALHQMGFMKN